MWIKLSVGSNWLFVRVDYFYFVPGSSYEILDISVEKQPKRCKTTVPTSPAKLDLQLQVSFEHKCNRVDNIAVSECMRWWPSAWCCHHRTSGMCVLPPLLSWPAWLSWMPTWWSRIRGHERSASASLSLLGMSVFLLSFVMSRFGSEQKCGRLDEDTPWSFGSSISSCWRSSFTLSSRTVRLIARVWRRLPGRLWLYCCPFVCQASTWFWWLWTAWNTSVPFGGRRTWGDGFSGWLWTCLTCWICRQIFGSRSGRVCPFGQKVWCSSTATFCFWFFPACPWARSVCRVTTCPLRRWCSILFSVWSPSTLSLSSYVVSTWCSSRTAGFPPSSSVRTWWPSRPKCAPFSSTGNSRENSRIERTQPELPWKSSRTQWDTDKLFQMLRASHMNLLRHGRLWIHDQGTQKRIWSQQGAFEPPDMIGGNVLGYFGPALWGALSCYGLRYISQIWTVLFKEKHSVFYNSLTTVGNEKPSAVFFLYSSKTFFCVWLPVVEVHQIFASLVSNEWGNGKRVQWIYQRGN